MRGRAMGGRRLSPAAAGSSAALGAGGDELLLDLVGGQRAGHARAVLEHHRGRAVDLVLAAERRVALQGAGVALAHAARRRLALDHPVAPDLALLLGAPDVA